MGGICSSSDEKSFTKADLDLIKAVTKQDVDAVAAALEAGGDPYCRSPTLSSKSKGRYTGGDAVWGMSSIHIAAANGNLQILDQLLNTSEDNKLQLTWMADTGEANAFRGTPLEHAVENGHPRVGLRLIETGARVPPPNRNLLQRAIKVFFSSVYIQDTRCDTQGVMLFLSQLIQEDSSAAVEWRNPQQQTLLHELVSNAVLVQPLGNIDGADGAVANVIRALLDVGVDPNVTDVNGALASGLDTKADLTTALAQLPTAADLERPIQQADNTTRQ